MIAPRSLLYERAVKIAFYSDQHDLRFILALVEMMWAGALFSPLEYSVSDWIPNGCLGTIFAGTALVQFYVIARCDYHSPFVAYFSFWNFVLWSLMALALYLNGFTDFVTISANAGLALGAAWLWVRSGFKNKGNRACDHEC